MSHTSSQFPPKTKRPNRTERINTVITAKRVWVLGARLIGDSSNYLLLQRQISRNPYPSCNNDQREDRNRYAGLCVLTEANDNALFPGLFEGYQVSNAPDGDEIPSKGGMYIELKPTNPRAAAFGVHCDRGDVHSFSFGGSGYHNGSFPYERR